MKTIKRQELENMSTKELLGLLKEIIYHIKNFACGQSDFAYKQLIINELKEREVKRGLRGRRMNKIKCDCCNKSFKGLWKDYRTDENDINSKYYVCGNCKNLNNVAFFMQMYKGKGGKK